MKKSVKLTTSMIRVCFSLIFLMLFSLSTLQLQAQQNPYPFNLDLSFGGGLIGNPDVNTTFQPELGFSYMPGKFGVGLNAGLLSYDPSFDAQQYAAGFEDYTSVSGSDEKWSSFFFGIGPRFEFGSSLPVTFRSSLDLSLSYNSPPSVSVDFNDPDGTAGDLALQLSGYEAGEDYSKWSAALRPEFQMQFSPGGSDRFAITVATGIQHRLSQNEFTYSQRDLSEVRVVPNSQEMFMQFEMAPEVQQTAQPPQTNFFTTVGIKIKFGGSRAPAAPGGGYNATRSNKPVSIANDGGGDCDDTDCPVRPEADVNGEIILGEDRDMVMPGRSEAEVNYDDCDDDGSCPHPDELLHKAKELELASAGNDIQNIKEVLDRCGEEVCGQVRLNADKRHEGVRRALENPSTIDSEIEEIRSIVREDVESLGKCETDACREVLAMEQQLLMKMNRLSDIAKLAPVQDYNSARSNKPSSIAVDIGDGDPDSDDDGIDDAIETAQDYNSSRSNKPNTEISDDIWDDCDDDGSCPHPDELLHRAKELELASAGNDIQNIKEVLDRCDEGVCGQVRQHADDRHHEVESALENPTEIDTHIEEILNIVKEDVESLGKCETDVCREVLAMEEQLLVKMNRLSDIAKLAPVQDYNSARSNKPSSIAVDIGDGDPDSDDDGIDDGTERAEVCEDDGNGNVLCGETNHLINHDPDNDNVAKAISMARLIHSPNVIIAAGPVAMVGNPLFKKDTHEGENPLYEGQANDGDADNNDDDNLDPSTVQKYELQPSSYCMKISTNSQQGMRSDAQSHNSSRSNRTEGVAKPDLDGDGFPDIMKSASFSISKRSARTGRNPNYNLKDDKKRKGLNAVNVKVKGIVDNGDADGDGYGDAVGFHFDLEIDPIDPDDDGDGLGDVIESASYSISKRSARTGRNESQDSQLETAPPNNVHQWTYDLNSLAEGQDIPEGTLTVLFIGGEWHFDVQVDPDDDGDGFGDLLQNSSFSISKRSARTGRNR